jgi:lichenan operon transcriptional antiterminator
MLTTRQQKIVCLLQQHPKGLTGEELSNLLDVSSRTIRSDMRNMGEEVQEKGAVIHADTRSGYHLEILDAEIFREVLRQMHMPQMNSSADRAEYIIRRFFEAALQDISLSQQELADSLFVSLSTLKNDMKEANRKLADYGLKISAYKIEGMRLAGEESKLRNFISEYLFRTREIQEIPQQNFYASLFPDADFSVLLDIIMQISESYELHLTDTAIYNLVVHTAIAIERARHGNTMVYTLRQSKIVEKAREFEVATSIFEEVFRKTQIDVATSEIYYLAQHIMASKKYMDINEASMDHMHVLVMDIMDAIQRSVNINFTQDKTLIDWLSMHLKTAVPRMRFQMNIRNDVLDVIKSEYPLAFQIAVIASDIIEKEEHITVNENEIGYIAIHFGAALNRIDIKNDTCIRRVLLVCASGMGTAILMRSRLEEYFKDHIVIVGTIPGYKLTQQAIDDVDIILTTVPIRHLQSDKIIAVRHLLDTDELTALERRFFRQRHGVEAEIEDFFCKDSFYLSTGGTSRQEILTFLTDELKAKGLMNDSEAKSVFEREAASPTEIGNLVAIPHAIYSDPPTSRISVMILDKPIVWEEEKVQIIFLISIAKAQFALWQPIFLKLFKYLVKNNGVKEMLHERTYEAFMRNFAKRFDTL